MRRKQFRPGKTAGEQSTVIQSVQDKTAPLAAKTRVMGMQEEDMEDDDEKNNNPPTYIMHKFQKDSPLENELDLEADRLVVNESHSNTASPVEVSHNSVASHSPSGKLKLSCSSPPEFIKTQSIPMPVLADIGEDCESNDTNFSRYEGNLEMVSEVAMSPHQSEIKPRPPYKGTMVQCGKLKDYLDMLPTFNRKCMLRKGREVHKIYVDMTKGETFLDDQFVYTEFGKMVLTNGSIRAGRAKNAKQIVVARETLYCSGTSACKRACGGYGNCLSGCDKTKMRGHRCSYRIKLTQRLGFVNHWFVEELGSHDQLHGKDSDFKVNSQMASALQEPGSGDFSGQLKLKITNISAKSPRKLAPKPNKTPSPERASDRTKEDMNTSETLADSQPAYNYVLGSLSNGHSSLDSLSSVKSVSSQPCYKYDHSNDISTNVSSSQPQNTIDLIKTAVSSLAQTFSQDLPSVSSTSAMNPLLQANLINYMTTMSQFGLAGGSLLQNGAVNPFLVNIKQEPGSNDMEGHNFLPFPHHLGVIPTPIQFMPSQIARASQPRKSHSPSPSRSSDHGQSQGQSREWSPMNRDQMPPGQLQKVMEIEARIKSETSNKVQAHQKTLGQVHTRIMERVKSRKSSHTQCVPQKQDENVMDLSKSSVVVNHCQNRAMENSSLKSGASKALNKGEEQCSISSTAYQRLQTLSHIIQSEAFQNAKNQLEKKPIGQWNGHGEDTALNLSKKTIVPSTRENNDQQQCYFKLAEAWRNGISLGPSDLLNGKICQGADRPGAIDDQKRKVNGHLGKVELDKLAVNPHVPSQREEELMTRVRQLEAQVKQLQNSMVEKTAGVAVAEVGTSKRKKAPRQIDFTKFNTRHVALKVMYLGHDYTGFAGISDDEHTVERAVMEALVKCKLIESKETAFYTRCGRTDKGVSAFGQVLSLDLRSNLLSGVGVKVREGGTAHERTGDKTTEIRYCQILNKNLPPEIRALAWAPVDPDFSARFNCNKRTYKYFFPRGNLNVKLMEQAGQKLVGEHDFRNFCKMSVKDGVINYVRKILEVQIKPFEDSDDGFTMYELTIVGQAFLWHQIRCIFAVLFLVGKGKESIEVVEELLNVTKNPRKPQFNIASDIPLCLYDADFGDQFEWVYEADWHEDNIKCLQQLWAEHAIKAAMVKSMLNDLDRAKVETECDIAPWSDLSPPVLHQAEWLLLDKFNKPLLQRQGGLTLEEQIANNRDRLTERGIDLENKNSADSCDENEDPPAAKRPRLEEGKGSEVEKSREQVVEKGKAEGQGGDVGIVSQDDNGKMVKSKGEDMRFKGDLEDEKVQVELEEDKVVQYIVDKDKVWNADDKYVNNDVK